MELTDVTQKLQAFIAENILAEGVELTPETILGDLGVDSFSVVEIVLFLERAFGVALPDEALTPENLKTVNSLAAAAMKYA
ncbi:UNVERIFIED_CONTAM: hypothetical protein GTU68_009977 [Idotea baltica]|nr:hypothetical protein [Idotea baltica]